jgi:hypothetical protein
MAKEAGPEREAFGLIRRIYRILTGEDGRRRHGQWRWSKASDEWTGLAIDTNRVAFIRNFVLPPAKVAGVQLVVLVSHWRRNPSAFAYSSSGPQPASMSARRLDAPSRNLASALTHAASFDCVSNGSDDQGDLVFVPERDQLTLNVCEALKSACR